MADSIEQRIVDRVVLRMQGILTANTYLDSHDNAVHYETEIGANVEDGRINWDESELPATSIFTGTVVPSSTIAADDEQIAVTRDMPLIISVSFPRFDTAATDSAYARKVIRDIYAVLRHNMRWRNDSNLDPLALYTEEVSHTITRAEQTYELTGVEVTAKIAYGTHYMTME